MIMVLVIISQGGQLILPWFSKKDLLLKLYKEGWTLMINSTLAKKTKTSLLH